MIHPLDNPLLFPLFIIDRYNGVSKERGMFKEHPCFYTGGRAYEKGKV